MSTRVIIPVDVFAKVAAGHHLLSDALLDLTRFVHALSISDEQRERLAAFLTPAWRYMDEQRQILTIVAQDGMIPTSEERPH